MKIYVASGLENYVSARKLMNSLRENGFEITYDWTMLIGPLGPITALDHSLIKAAAVKEARGVETADILVALMPGGRGTHTEIGIALGTGKPVVIAAPEAAGLFQHGLPCSFYYHPGVEALLITPDAELIAGALQKIWRNKANV